MTIVKPWDHFPVLSLSFPTSASHKVPISLLFSSHRVSTSFLQLLDCCFLITSIPPSPNFATKSSRSSQHPSIMSARTRFLFHLVFQHRLGRKTENEIKSQLQISEDSCASLSRTPSPPLPLQLQTASSELAEEGGLKHFTGVPMPKRVFAFQCAGDGRSCVKWCGSLTRKLLRNISFSQCFVFFSPWCSFKKFTGSKNNQTLKWIF